MPSRVFKTKHFAATAKKVAITDAQLCAAIREVMKGQASDLGGGVWKKRLNENLHRSIILAKGRNDWVYQFVFAKKDESNISDKELVAFKKLAEIYQGLSQAQVTKLLSNKEFVEICND